METKSAVLGAAGMLFAGGLAFAALGIANAVNEPAPAPSTVATVVAPAPTPEPVVTEPAPVETPAAPVVVEPVAPVVEPAPVVVAPEPVYVAPEPVAPVYVAPASEPGQNTYYSKPTAPPAVGPDPIKNTGRYDKPVTGEIYLNPADVPK